MVKRNKTTNERLTALEVKMNIVIAIIGFVAIQLALVIKNSLITKLFAGR